MTEPLMEVPADPPALIDSFRGEYRFLSNFYPVPVTWRGRTAPSSEHHYMAAKALPSPDGPEPLIGSEDAEAIYACATPGKAKRLGRQVVLRDGWDAEEKFAVMRSVLEAKFTDPTLREALLGTGEALLVEGNTWHDQCWGDCSCPTHQAVPGANHLGRTLMAVRSRLRGEPEHHWPRVALTGHRIQHLDHDQRVWVRETLPGVVTRLRRDHGTVTAISGLALGCDTWWAQTALDAGLPVWGYVPFAGQDSRWQSHDREVYAGLRTRLAREVVLEPDGVQDRAEVMRLLHARNHLMIRDADLLVAVHLPDATTGGTAAAIRHARKVGTPLLRVNPVDRTVTFVPPVSTPTPTQGATR